MFLSTGFDGLVYCFFFEVVSLSGAAVMVKFTRMRLAVMDL